jgi:GxxExxY protein
MSEKGELNALAESILGAAIAVHRELGPGLLESAYEACLENVLGRRGFAVERQKELPVRYQGLLIDAGYRIDLLINGKVIVELKAVDPLHPIHEAQVITYLGLSGCRLALLLNFNVLVLKKGIKRLVHNFPD